MAAPTFVAAGTVAAGVGNVTPGLPTGWAENDIFELFVETYATDGAPATPSGYTLVGSVVSGLTGSATEPRCTLFEKRATASESAPTIVDVGNHQIARIIAFRGVKTTGDPQNVAAVSSFEQAKNTSISITGLTTTVDDCMIAVFKATGNDRSVASWTNTNLASITEATDDLTLVGNDGAIASAYGVLASFGATGATTATLSGADRDANWCIALEPVADGDQTLVGDPGALQLTGAAAALAVGLSSTPGALLLTGSEATLRVAHLLQADPGALQLTGAAAALAVGLSSAPGALLLTGAEATLSASRLLQADPGALILTGADADLVDSTPVVVVRRGGVRWLREDDPVKRAEKVKELTTLIKPAIKAKSAVRLPQEPQKSLLSMVSDATARMTPAQQTRTDRLLQQTGISLDELLILLQ